VQDFGLPDGGETQLAAAQSPLGRIYSGNPGLFELEGNQWHRVTATGNFSWQCLSADDAGRIWAGTNREIGVFESGSDGVLRYRSLTALLPISERDVGDVWNVHVCGKEAVFVGNGRVVRTDGADTSSWSLPVERRLYSWVDNGETYIGAADGRVYLMTRTGPIEQPLPVKLAVSVIGWAEGLGGESWLTITEKGLLSSGSPSAEVFSEVNKLLRKSAPVTAVRIPDGRLAVGTFFGGLFLIDTETGAFERLGEGDGLRSECITGLIPGGRDWLWVMTTRGLSRIATSGAVVAYGEQSGMSEAGILSVGLVGNSLSVSTDSGRFMVPVDGSTPEARKIDNKWIFGQVPVGALTLGGSLGGLFRVSSEGIARVESEPLDVTTVVASSVHHDFVYYATGPIIRAARVQGEGVEIISSETLESTIDDAVESLDGDIWVSEGTRVTRLSLSVADGTLVKRQSYAISELANGLQGKTNLFQIGDVMFATRGGSLLGFDRQRDTFEALRDFDAVEFIDVTSTFAGDAWALARPKSHGGTSPQLIHLQMDPRGLTAEVMDAPGLYAYGNLRSVHTVPGVPGQPELWVGANSAILRVDVGRVGVAMPSSEVALRMVQDLDGVLGEVAPSIAEFPYGPKTLGFRWSTLSAMPGELFIETRLLGANEDWKASGKLWAREFTGLGDGSYVFQARAVDALGRPGPIVTRSFAVLPPWYRTTGAVTGFCVSALLFGWVGWQLRIRVARRRADELEGLVDLRTRELERVNAEKTRFIARMNHEIRNPLNGLLGAIGILEHSAHTGREGRMVQILRTCADHLGAVVEDVLNFSNIEGGRIVVQDRAFSVAAMIEAVPRMMLAEADRTGTEVSATVMEGVPAVVIADPDRIRQILVNFTGNALKFAPGEPVEIEVAPITVEGEPWLRFAVRDHGPGISEPDKQLLFSMFERGKSAATRNVKGMGIGLATCRLLARRMGGEVGVISGLGEGSEFFLRLPLKVAPEGQKEVELPPAEMHRLSCLVVEDQEFNRVILRDMLERLGCSVDEAADAETAVNLAAMNRYDAVFTDLELPDAAPGEILKMLEGRRPSGNGPGPALVVTTAYATENVRQTCLAAGATAFLAKPLSASKVLVVLRDIDLARRPNATVVMIPPAPAQESGHGAIGHLARIRGCEVGSVAAEIGRDIDGETKELHVNARLGNARGIASQAHRLLSLAALADTPELAGIAVSIQTDARNGRIPSIEKLAALTQTVAAVKEKLDSITGDGSAGGQSRDQGRNEPTASSHSD